MRTKVMVALLLAVMLVCSVSALAEEQQLSVNDLARLYYNQMLLGVVDPYSEGGEQYAQHLLYVGNSPEVVEQARYQAAMALNARFGTNYGPLNGPQLGDDSVPLSLLAGLAALALGGAVFAHRRCRQC